MIRERGLTGEGEGGGPIASAAKKSEVTRPVTMPQYRGLRNGRRDIKGGFFHPRMGCSG